MGDLLKLTEREISEIELAMVYAKHFHHGTAGHNGYMVLAKLAEWQGFSVDEIVVGIHLPDHVEIVEK